MRDERKFKEVVAYRRNELMSEVGE